MGDISHFYYGCSVTAKSKTNNGRPGTKSLTERRARTSGSNSEVRSRQAGAALIRCPKFGHADQTG